MNRKNHEKTPTFLLAEERRFECFGTYFKVFASVAFRVSEPAEDINLRRTLNSQKPMK